MIFLVFSCSHLSKFLSDPITKQRAVSKRVQESNLKEGSEVAKPKPVNLNFSSMRKILSQEVRDPNSPGNQSLDPSGVPARSWKQSAQGRGPSLRTAEADSGCLEKVFKKKKRKAESCTRCTTSEDPSTQNQHIHLVNVYVDINEGSGSYGTRLY